MRLPIIRRLKACFSAFHADQSGIALIYITAALPVIIGFSLLAIDVGRISTLQSSLQHGADALALAGAGELDRSPNAIDRADLAITNLVTTNKGLFANAPVTVNSGNITKCYLDALPALDSSPLGTCKAVATAANRTASSPSVRYVQVVVNPTAFTTIFPASLIGVNNNTAAISAQAVAGFDAAVCNFTPMFMCNPLEPANNGDLTNDFGLSAMASSYTTRRRIIRFLAFTGGNNATAVPGQFGFLSTHGGASALGDEIASVSPPDCYLLNTLQTQTGSMTGPLLTAFNTRFDMYTNTNNTGAYTATAYPPGINVRKGFIPPNGNGNSSICTANAGTSSTNASNANVMAMPIDSCFATNTCANVSPYNNANIGNGDWGYDPDNSSTKVSLLNSGSGASAITGYWTKNFIGTSGNTATLPTPPDSGVYSNSKLPSRYDLYRYEISSGYYNRYSVTGGTTNTGQAQETGLPRCAASNSVTGVDSTTGSVDRRVLYGAIMNCAANGLRPGSPPSAGYHALAFGKFFMVRPITSANTLWTELIDLVYPGDGTGVARDKVQLYR